MDIIHSTNKFNVIKSEDKSGIQPINLSVAILPFTHDGRGLPTQLGIIIEENPFRSGKAATVITGKADGEDPDVLAAAQKRMMKITGLDVQDVDRWFFLGFLTTHKWVMQEIPCFAVDITGMSYNEPEEKDPKKEFVIMHVNKALEYDDCYIPAMFMKIFKLFGYMQDEEKTDVPKTDAQVNTEKELLRIEGVIGAGSKNNNEWVINVKAGIDTESIKSRAQSILGDEAKIKIEEVKQDKTKSDGE